jgi:hypothetical protein
MRTLAFLLLVSACVENKPIIDTKREAGTAPIPTVELPEDLPPDDPPTCVSCSKVLLTGFRGGAACVRNASPSSAQNLGKYVTCACQKRCTAVCGAHCAGSARNSECTQCMQSQCAAELQACEGEP